MKNLVGKCAVVTGAGNGIGLALATSLAREKMNVVLADLDDESLADATRDLRQLGVEVLMVKTDVSVESSVAALADAAREAFGPVAVLCSNAGIGSTGAVDKTPMEVWRRTIDINFFGHVHCLSAFLPDMRKHGDEAHIVLTASAGGVLTSGPLFPFKAAPYVASKHATVGLAECAYYQLANTAINVSCLCPSVTATRMGTRGGRDSAEVIAKRGNRTIQEAERIQELMARAQGSEEVAAATIAAIREERFWVVPQPNILPDVQQRFEAIAGKGEMPPPREWIE